MPLSNIVYFCCFFPLYAPCKFFPIYFSRQVRLLWSTFFHFTCVRVYFLAHHKKDNKLDFLVRGYYDTSLLKDQTVEKCQIVKKCPTYYNENSVVNDR